MQALFSRFSLRQHACSVTFKESREDWLPYEKERNLGLDEGCSTIDDAIHKLVKVDRFDAQNAAHCEVCDKLVRKHTHLEFEAAPPVLALSFFSHKVTNPSRDSLKVTERAYCVGLNLLNNACMCTVTLFVTY